MYKGNKEHIYARIVKKGEPQSVLVSQMTCVEDSESFAIYNTDISGKTFVVDESDDPQYRYKIAVELDDEHVQLFENFSKDHFYHDFEIVTENNGSYVIQMNSMIMDDKIVIAFFDNESDARVYYKTIE